MIRNIKKTGIPASRSDFAGHYGRDNTGFDTSTRTLPLPIRLSNIDSGVVRLSRRQRSSICPNCHAPIGFRSVAPEHRRKRRCLFHPDFGRLPVHLSPDNGMANTKAGCR